MVTLCKTVAESSWFQNFVTAVILFAGFLVGCETYPGIVAEYGDIIHILDTIILGIFVVEIVVKMVAEIPKPWRYFYDGWNVFDFVIVAGAFIPFISQYATVLRLLRLLRVLKLVRALPRLQLLVGALLKSIPSMGYVSLLLLMLFYVYAVAAVFMWGGNDPVHFGSLEISLVSLFRAVTLEDWTDLMYIQMYGCANYGYDGMAEMCTQSAASPVAGALFFISFVLVGTMVFLNLFVGVILSGMDEAQKEADMLNEAEQPSAKLLDTELSKLLSQLSDVQEQLERMQFAAKQHPVLAELRLAEADTAEAAE